MLTLPDLREKQILFIKAEHGVFNKIKFENDNIVFMKDNVVINRASCHKVFAVFVMGDMTVTTGVLREASKLGVSFFFMKNNFNSYASVNSHADGNYILRNSQYIMDNNKSFEISKKIVLNKIKNQKTLLAERKVDKKILEKFKKLENSVLKTKDEKSLLGTEGNASKIFFKEYFKDFDWVRRSPRTRQDIVNFLMDIGYTTLFNFIDSLLNLYGFDTYKGVYHKLFFQRKSLSCDVMEPFRCIIDKQILKSLNLKQINKKDFKVDNGMYELEYKNSQKYAEIFMSAIMEKKEDMYVFVQSFYRYIIDDEKYNFPEFKI
ncbi:hypothetical protein A2996_00935 [Candidatus Campbellbacteria bacterium RIFCSPLOWO2_01_FULL_34_15]|uniref:CRISPR-associated endonuclease Cas1 n=1 Tax=Candidatus Campbellbacteria bacterium RIFCSPLOWO2_01_FULL_34_15 TaxID=1797579 RepID=A0A1F5EN01_9BACT|nr:MAG: hypothetical protein A2996_00935 [Candidatus Campbellbacteria bacterium RIFCSPLOWO2_01_FULL_34_15]